MLKTKGSQMQDIKIYNYLSEKPISREELANRLGIVDRSVRDSIARLRKKGIPICSKSNGKGYWLGNAEDVKKTTKELQKRANDLLDTVQMMRLYQERAIKDGRRDNELSNSNC